MGLRRTERLVRSTILATPFMATNLLTHYEIAGRRHLEAALAQRARSGCGLVTISNHLSLFDDPMVLFKLLGIRHYSVESKCWWSTPCESNFSPSGSSSKDRFVRYFSDVSNMVFFARRGKLRKQVELVSEYAAIFEKRGGPELMSHLEAAAAREGQDVETWLRRFVTLGHQQHNAALNQVGMIEACARIATGDWLHFFPEGGRARTLHLRAPKKGVGKVLYHSEGAIILPICFYGMQDVWPVNATLPRLFKRVVVTIGEPVSSRQLAPLRAQQPGPEAFQALVDEAWESVSALRLTTLARYLGTAQAENMLRTDTPAAAAPAAEPIGSHASVPQVAEASGQAPCRPLRARRAAKEEISPSPAPTTSGNHPR